MLSVLDKTYAVKLERKSIIFFLLDSQAHSEYTVYHIKYTLTKHTDVYKKQNVI